MAGCFVLICLLGGLIPFEISNYFEWAIFACIVGIIALVIVFLNALLFDRKALTGLVGRVKAVLRK